MGKKAFDFITDGTRQQAANETPARPAPGRRQTAAPYAPKPVDRLRRDRIDTSCLSVHVPTHMHQMVKILAVQKKVTLGDMIKGWIEEKLAEHERRTS